MSKKHVLPDEIANGEGFANHVLQLVETGTGSLTLGMRNIDLWEQVGQAVRESYLPDFAAKAVQEFNQERASKGGWMKVLTPSFAGVSAGLAIGSAMGGGVKNWRNKRRMAEAIFYLFHETNIVRAGGDLNAREKSVAKAAATWALARNDQEGYLHLFDQMFMICVGGTRGEIVPCPEAHSNIRYAGHAEAMTKLVLTQFFKRNDADYSQWLAEALGQYVRVAQGEAEASPDARQIIATALNKGSTWYTREDLDAGMGPYKHFEEGTDLFLGRLETGEFIGTNMGESAVLIGMPGSKKTQSLIYPTLLTATKFPIVCLDVKGELRKNTAGFHAANGRRVLTLDFTGEGETHAFNVLDFVRRDADHLWSEMRRLAQFLVPEIGGENAFFRDQGVNVFATCLGGAMLKSIESGKAVSWPDALDMLFADHMSQQDFFEETSRAAEAYGSRPLKQAADRYFNMIEEGGMTLKQYLGFVNNATGPLEDFRGGVVDRIGAYSSFFPQDLRDPNTTLFLCVREDELLTMGGYIRMIIDCLLRHARRGETETGGPALTFILDEIGNIGDLTQFASLIATARGAGIRALLCFQDAQQAEQACKTPNILLKNPRIRMFMNPSLETAKDVSAELGEVEDVMTGTRKRLAEAPELMGPDYQDTIVTLSSGCRALRMVKHPAYADESLKERMGWPYQWTPSGYAEEG